MLQVLQLAGAALVLLGYAARQRLSARALEWANGAGALLLVVTAVAARQWGFTVLNVVWATIAVARLWAIRRGAIAAARRALPVRSMPTPAGLPAGGACRCALDLTNPAHDPLAHLTAAGVGRVAVCGIGLVGVVTGRCYTTFGHWAWVGRTPTGRSWCSRRPIFLAPDAVASLDRVEALAETLPRPACGSVGVGVEAEGPG